ncbi:aldehyde dehydrogenase [Fusarium sporotrichioides]|uniref:aldehyde dehydrogenase (NAD(+)) n=1 Tax=Fusarium sporotrichioides TaxID=5514 RepID=A0A395SBE3_FUSSP|nr:aldehyde dehydrogenase [Fusarium sporotrichioides]
MAVGSSKQLNFTEYYNLIDGKLETTKETLQNTNPSTLEKNHPVPVSTQEDVDRAVEAAKKASEAWADVPYKERQDLVAKYADGIDANKDEFAILLVKEQGKSIQLAHYEIMLAVQFLKGYASLPDPEQVIEDKPGRKVVTKYVPLGVAVGIVPWNFPIFLATAKIGPALIAGNAFILKPSPFTPYCGLKLAELANQYFPTGVVQALSGDDNLGPWLTAHPGVDKISFTGSTATGKKVLQSAAPTLKRVTLELGGNDPAIICDDVDVKEIAPKIAFGALMNSGQLCMAIKRIYAHESIYDDLVKELAAAVNSFTVGDGLDSNTALGPVQNHLQFDRVKNLLADIESQGYKLAAGSTSASTAGKGYFITPTIVENPPDDSRIVVEEPFGPVFPVLKWTDEADVLRRANDNPMGLSASVWTKDMEKAERMSSKIKAGTVWINAHHELNYNVAFGGAKQSGLGAEHGIEGIKAYCTTKSLYFNAA